MKYKLVIFDVDGTLTREDNSWKLIHTSLDVYEQAKEHRKLFFGNEITYQKWADLDVGLWKNVHLSRIEQVLNRVELNDGIAETISILKRKNYLLTLLSSGISIFTNKIKEKFGFDFSISNEVIVDDQNLLTGEVICHVGFNKAEAIENLLQELKIGLPQCIAIGDAENDVILFKRVGLSIAFNPKTPEVKEAADIALYGSDLRKILDFIP